MKIKTIDCYWCIGDLVVSYTKSFVTSIYSNRDIEQIC